VRERGKNLTAKKEKSLPTTQVGFAVCAWLSLEFETSASSMFELEEFLLTSVGLPLVK